MKLAVIGGDGIGPEVVGEAVKVLDTSCPAWRRPATTWGRGDTTPPARCCRIRCSTNYASTTRSCSGAIGDPSVPSGVLERGLLLRLRFELDHHINLRPARLYPGVTSPLAGNPAIDFVVVREGTEGPYTGNGGAIRVGTPNEVATEVSVNTAFGVRRVVHDAFERAQRAPQASDAGAQEQCADLRRIAVVADRGRGRRRSTPTSRSPTQHVDAATIHLVTDPGRFDVIVTDNLFGDIITDLGRGGVRRHRPGRQRQYRRDPHQSVDVRAGARQRARHRRPGHRRPDRGDHVGGAAACPPRRG